MTKPLKVTVLGTGTSAGVPVIGCDCPTCTSSDPNDNRLRSSIVLRDDQHTILVDCGSDFREQALRYHINRLDVILLTHAHSDHVSGLDDIRIYNWRQGTTIPFYGNKEAFDSLKRRFDYIFAPMQTGGGIPQVELNEVSQTFECLGLKITPLPVMHGDLPVLGFRFGNFAYITDASEVPKETREKLKGVKYLILNALRYRDHPTHLTVDQAVEIAQEVGAERTWFTHITHDLKHSDVNQHLPEGIRLGYDGLEFNIEAETV